MSGSIRTSTVIDALLDVKSRLDALVFPANDATGDSPEPYFLGFWTDMASEYVHLVGKVSDDEVSHAGSGPSTREETYVLQISCGTAIRGTDGPEAMRRLGEIVEVVEVAFRDQTTGHPIPPDLDDAEIVKGGIERIEVDGYQTDTGTAAIADIYLRVYARV